jgi:hypothetical protein
VVIRFSFRLGSQPLIGFAARQFLNRFIQAFSFLGTGTDMALQGLTEIALVRTIQRLTGFCAILAMWSSTAACSFEHRLDLIRVITSSRI